MINFSGVNYAIQEVKAITALFGYKPDDSIDLCDFLDTWVSKHDILIENTLRTMFSSFD